MTPRLRPVVTGIRLKRGWNGAYPATCPGGGPKERRLSVFGPVIEPARMWTALRERHYRLINPVEARVLALVAQGYNAQEAARLMDVTPATVRRHVAEVCHRLFETTEIPQERDKLRVWIAPHLTCCIPLVHEMIENDRRTV